MLYTNIFYEIWLKYTHILFNHSQLTVIVVSALTERFSNVGLTAVQDKTAPSSAFVTFISNLPMLNLRRSWNKNMSYIRYEYEALQYCGL